MPDPNASAPPSFYNSQAQSMATGAGAVPPGGGAKPQGDDAEIMAAVGKIAGALKKMGAMKDGAQPYIDRAMTAIKEMVVDVFKADPKSLDTPPSGDGASAAPPPPDSAASAAPPPPAA